jgi:hypothetical protein
MFILKMTSRASKIFYKRSRGYNQHVVWRVMQMSWVDIYIEFQLSLEGGECKLRYVQRWFPNMARASSMH